MCHFCPCTDGRLQAVGFANCRSPRRIQEVARESMTDQSLNMVPPPFGLLGQGPLALHELRRARRAPRQLAGHGRSCSHEASWINLTSKMYTVELSYHKKATTRLLRSKMCGL